MPSPPHPRLRNRHSLPRAVSTGAHPSDYAARELWTAIPCDSLEYRRVVPTSESLATNNLAALRPSVSPLAVFAVARLSVLNSLREHSCHRKHFTKKSGMPTLFIKNPANQRSSILTATSSTRALPRKPSPDSKLKAAKFAAPISPSL